MNPLVKQAVILAGGLGTRLGVLARQIPKPLLPVGGTPFIDILINELARYGVRDVIVSAGHLGDRFVDHFRDWRPRAGLACSVRVRVEPEPLGTAGALVHSAAELDDAFLLLNGDSWFDLDWLDFLNRSRQHDYWVSIALREIDDTSRYGSVELSGDRLVSFREKGRSGPGLISGGVYHLRRRVLNGIGTGFCSLEKDVLPSLVGDRAVGGWAYDGFFLDIGTPESYAAAQVEVGRALSRRAILFRAGDLWKPVSQSASGQAPAPYSAEFEALRLAHEAGSYVFLLSDAENTDLRLEAGIQELRLQGAQADCVICESHGGNWVRTINAVFHDWDVRRSDSLFVGAGDQAAALAERLGVGFVNVVARRIDEALRSELLWPSERRGY